MERVTTLFRAAHDPTLRVIVVAAPALLDRVPPRATFRETVLEAVAGRELDREQLIDWLVSAGYHRVPQAEDPGTFAVRGGIVDVWSPLYPDPIRLELFGDECERIRTFDPATQGSAAAQVPSAVARGPASRPLDVLCAEDNPYGRVVLNTILTELGHRADFVGAGAAAVDAVSRRHYDVVLMDVTLPDIDGFEATRRIRALAGSPGRVPVLGISGRADAADEAESPDSICQRWPLPKISYRHRKTAAPRPR